MDYRKEIYKLLAQLNEKQLKRIYYIILGLLGKTF